MSSSKRKKTPTPPSSHESSPKSSPESSRRVRPKNKEERVASQVDKKANTIIELLDKQKKENNGTLLISPDIKRHISAFVSAHVTRELALDIYELLQRIRVEFSAYNQYIISNIFISELVKRMRALDFENNEVVKHGMRCISRFCEENGIRIDDIVTINCVLIGHSNNKTCDVANMSKKKVANAPPIIHAVAPGHQALFTMVPHIGDVMSINPQTGTPYIETLRDVRRKVNTYYENHNTYYEEQLEIMKKILHELKFFKTINFFPDKEKQNEYLKKRVLNIYDLDFPKDTNIDKIDIDDVIEHLKMLIEKKERGIKQNKDTIEKIKTREESVFGTYSSLNPNVLPLKILEGTECSDINRPTFFVIFESQLEIVKCIFYLFMKYGNDTSSGYLMIGNYNNYEECVDTFKDTLKNNGLNRRTNYLNNFDITSSNAISRHVLQHLLDYMYDGLNPKMDDILPAISDSGGRELKMDPSWVVSYLFPIISTIYITCCRVGEIPSRGLTRKNSEPKLGGSRYKKSKCPYCGNHTNSMMYFDFRNYQKIVSKIVSWDKLFVDTAVQNNKKPPTSKTGDKRKTRKAISAK